MVSLKCSGPYLLKCRTVGIFFCPSLISERFWFAHHLTQLHISPTYCSLHFLQLTKYTTLDVWHVVCCRSVTLSPVFELVTDCLKLQSVLAASTSWVYFARPETRVLLRITSVGFVFVCNVDLETPVSYKRLTADLATCFCWVWDAVIS